MDLSQPRPLRLGGTGTHFSAKVVDGMVIVDAARRTTTIEDALRAGRYIGASSEWKAAMVDAMSRTTGVWWRCSDVDFGVPAGYGVGEAPTRARSASSGLSEINRHRG